MAERVLVTGGAGFIGSHVVDRLQAAGYEPRIFDRMAPPHTAPAGVETIAGDVRSADDLAAAMDSCDAVVHLAAIADVAHVAQDPAHAEAVNTRGVLNVLEAARANGIASVVYASTIWVYDGLDGAVDESSPLGEPRHFYTATKLAGEHYCRTYGELYGMEPTVLRFGIPYGPRARSAAVVPAFVSRALRGEPLTLAGGGLQSRRFVYVEDLADGVVRALLPIARGRTYNLTREQDVTIADVARCVDALLGPIEIVHGPARQGDFSGAAVSAARAADELGWRADTPFEDGVRSYVEWLGVSTEFVGSPAGA